MSFHQKCTVCLVEKLYTRRRTQNSVVDMLNDASIFRVKCLKQGHSRWVNNVAVGGWVGGWLKRCRLLDPLSAASYTSHPSIPSFHHLCPSIHQTSTHQPHIPYYKIWILPLLLLITTTNTIMNDNVKASTCLVSNRSPRLNLDPLPFKC